MSHKLPELPGLISAHEIAVTADAIADWQLPSGMIPWFPGGHSDPWNHTEACMAMATAGRFEPALKGYRWLKEIQREDGSWFQYYLEDGVEEDKLDANTICYVATGIWHHYLLTGDESFVEEMWPMVEKAVDFVLDLQTPRGEILWARHSDGTPWTFALLTGSSSICHSLRCAIALAEHLGHERPDWELSAARLAWTIRHHEEAAFNPKRRWAMDWYYPVLTGVLRGEVAEERLAQRYDTFVMEGKGVRCVADRPWVTGAETCECMLAHLAIGNRSKAVELFEWAQRLRSDTGHYWTGTVYPGEVHFPGNEQSTYTDASVILAADALSQTTAASGLFTNHELLPELIDNPVGEEEETV